MTNVPRGDADGELRRHSHRAMGTQVDLVAAPGTDGRRFVAAAIETERVFAAEEQRFSRFREDSELSEVNARAGRWTRVSSEFGRVLDVALRAAERTGGLFDPTVLPALSAAGYDRTFDDLPGDLGVPAPDPPPCGRWRDIVRRSGDRVLLPAEVALDFGGIAKGWTADRAARLAASIAGASWLLVNAGGDLRVYGTTPPRGVQIAVETPERRDEELLRVRIERGALATSTTSRRSWGPGLHHLIDPRTSMPAMTDVVQATVWASTCTDAEIAAKEALLTGRRVLDRVPGVLVLSSGEVVTNIGPSLPRSEAGATSPAGTERHAVA
jgi:FAD:protein FMN transferase